MNAHRETATRACVRLVEPRASIAEADVERLVHAFYARVRADPVLGPIFAPRLAGRWEPHLAKMVDFWSAIACGTARYDGKPQVAHAGMALDEAAFARWLALFEETAREVCTPGAAAFLVDRAERIAGSLMIGLGVGPKALSLPA
ncbi:group III truncated hemoglobin [Salinarimonas ramus]|uniref:Preprotein translocase subunit TatC n=1 Tax=Salinarimonas ramus TaxID=690164 RepID=A0A917Q478_9HYPH|nr:group III truncated hemoglobin [Salinarimonas ramus]GGK20762.1 preprotein translocase subunit TatC [Salinarimonas ramus]